eukprot:m.70321 g.70321  ORF g.70321 m.70321 type:complete len:186 (-) comp13775_c0_seq1:138-695(-)
MAFTRVCVSLLVIAAAAVCAQEARLLVSKDIVNDIAVAERDLTVRYALFNVGDKEAKDIVLTDEGFTREGAGFTMVAGIPSFSLPSLAAGANVSHNVIVRAHRAGYYNMTAARVTYTASDDADAQQVVFSSMPRDIPVIPNSDFSRVYDSHFLQWTVFLAAAITLIVLPFQTYKASVEKYQRTRK